jgi:hypothetical protein
MPTAKLIAIRTVTVNQNILAIIASPNGQESRQLSDIRRNRSRRVLREGLAAERRLGLSSKNTYASG